MSEWADDINRMHRDFGIHDRVAVMEPETLGRLLDFRIAFLQEELDEMKEAQVAEDVVDALIDLVVVAIGTLDLFEVDADEAWNRVHAANVSKKVGIKASRPNPLGLPDLVKPGGFVSPDHKDNVGLLAKVFDE